jgi:hypothetical protein
MVNSFFEDMCKPLNAASSKPSSYTRGPDGRMASPHSNAGTDLDLAERGRLLILSDLHMGSGKRDDLAANGELLIKVLEDYYFPAGWTLILNGDIEELQRFRLAQIRERWMRLYQIFDRFNAEGRLYKNLGNHDEDLVFERNYPYNLTNFIRVRGIIPIYIYHGHQSSRIYMNYNSLLRAGVRYILKPFGIKNISNARSLYRRFSVEKKSYNFSMQNNCISIIGQTHRALIESRGRFDYIKYEIERLCRDYPSSEGEEKHKIEAEVAALLEDLRKLKRKERQDVLRQSLYGNEMPVPCLFNSGSAIGRKGINAIELDDRSIALVYWFAVGHERKFIRRGYYPVECLENSPYRRSVLNQDRLDYIKARIELLGAKVF